MGMGEKWRKEDLTEKIISACISVHKELGPGFLEGIYHNALKVEFTRSKLFFESEKELTVYYRGVEVGIHKIDLLVEHEVIVELKTVEDLNKKYYAQVRSYLAALNKKVGLLINFSGYSVDIRRVELKKLVKKTAILIDLLFFLHFPLSP
jgi:GxxExxY protein